MKNYELLYILSASKTTEEIVKDFQDVQKHLEKFGASMLTTLLEHPFLTKSGMPRDEEPEELRVLPMVKRKLAFPIKHEKFGYYVLVNFQAEEKKIEEIDEYLRLHSESLRHIITQADPMTKEQLELLETLFARKKAEQDREEAEKKESGAAKEEKRAIKREAHEEAKAEAPKAEETIAETTETEVKAEEAAALEKAEPEAEMKTEEAKAETAPEAGKEVEPKAEAKEEKKTTRKSKIKLEELEDKLDEILEDTIV